MTSAASTHEAFDAVDQFPAPGRTDEGGGDQ